jgi:hypothetical protein
MNTKLSSALLVPMALLTVSVLTAAQAGQQQNRTIVVNGQAGEATVVRMDGRTYVDLETLARIANGSVSFQGDRIILNFSGANASSASPDAENNDQPDSRFSQAFMNAGIQAVATIKQWRSTLAYAVQRGVPGDGSRTFVLHDKAAESVRLASAAASNDADRNGAQLLNNHFNNVQDWTNKLIEARKSMSTANLSMSPDALKDDPLYQKIAGCSAFLGETLAAGSFQDNPSCH